MSPDSGLKNNQTVMVSGSGYVPNSTLSIVECTKRVKGKKGLAGQPYCNIHNVVQTFATSQGVVPATSFTVTTGVIGDNGTTCGMSSKDAMCCIGLGDSNGDNNNDGLGKITFAVSQASP